MASVLFAYPTMAAPDWAWLSHIGLAVAEALNAHEFSLEGTIEQLDLVRYAEGVISPVAQLALTGSGDQYS